MLRPIKSKEEHSIYLSRAYELMQLDLSPNSIESDELEVISILIEAYEKELVRYVLPKLQEKSW